jgi:hypothetical protein
MGVVLAAAAGAVGLWVWTRLKQNPATDGDGWLERLCREAAKRGAQSQGAPTTGGLEKFACDALGKVLGELGDVAGDVAGKIGDTVGRANPFREREPFYYEDCLALKQQPGFGATVGGFVGVPSDCSKLPRRPK